MRKRIGVILFLAGLGLCAARPLSGSTPVPDASAALEIVAGAAVDALPSVLHDYFAPHRERLARGEQTVECDSAVVRDEPTDEARYIMLDVGAAAPDFAARHEAARAFPRSKETAQELFRKQGRRRGGILPWAVAETSARLQRAMEQARGADILEETSRLIAYATYASLPFHTTVDPCGEWTGQLILRGSRANPTEHAANVSERIESELTKRLRERLRFEARAWPGRVKPIPDVLDAVFDTLHDSHAALGPLLELDRSVLADLSVTNGQEFAARAEQYYARAASVAAPVLRERFEDGALLAARLITTAWIRSGFRPLPSIEEQPAEDAATVASGTGSDEVAEAASAEPAAPASPHFVASMNSTLFHKPSCPYAKRILPENQVEFDSIEKARVGGREPCKTCRPGDSP